MKLSVVIPCYNAEQTIGGLLESLASQDWRRAWEVIVVDNGSTDRSMAVADTYKRYLRNLRLVSASEKRGRSHARNVGADHAMGKALVFCDADDEVGDGWLKAIGEIVMSGKAVASRFDFDKLNSRSVAKIYEAHEQKRGIQKLWYPPFLLHAGCSGLGVMKSLHKSIGGFDETLPRLQDTDYCIRIQLAGHSLHFADAAVVHVRCREQFGRMFEQVSRWAEYNVFLYKKYGQPQRYELWRWKVYAIECRDLLRSLRNMKSKEERVALFWKVALQVGKLKGSVRYGVAPI